MQSSSLKLFSSAEQKPMLLKRQAFAMFSGELDQYHLYLPLIQGGGSRRISRLSLYVQLRRINSPFAFRAAHRDAADEPDARHFSPDVPDVSRPAVEDLVAAPYIPLAHNGHRTCKILVFGYKISCFYFYGDVLSLIFFFSRFALLLALRKLCGQKKTAQSKFLCQF